MEITTKQYSRYFTSTFEATQVPNSEPTNAAANTFAMNWPPTSGPTLNVCCTYCGAQTKIEIFAIINSSKLMPTRMIPAFQVPTASSAS